MTTSLPTAIEETSIEPSIRNPINVSMASIVHLPVDLFLRIIQPLIDEEAAEFFERFPSHAPNAPTSVRLALVNKRWRDVMYSSPTVWPRISLDLSQPMIQVQAKIDHLTSLRKNLPVDLYISNLHSHKDNWLLHYPGQAAKCAVRNEKLSISLQGITNLRSLSVQMSNLNAAPIFNPDRFPGLESLKRLRTSFLTIYGPPVELEPLLSKMPNLVELHLNNPGVTRPLSSTSPLLPKLRGLNLGSMGAIHVTSFMQLLSHTPNIENLSIGCFFSNPEYIHQCPKVTLTRLKRLQVDSWRIMPGIFTENSVHAPILEEYNCGAMDRRYNWELAMFFTQHPTIKKVSIVSRDSSWVLEDSYGQWNIEDLTLDVSHYSDGEWLSSFLCNRLAGDGIETMGVCENLRFLRINTRGDVPLLQSYFERFALARCVPVDSERNTSSGYKALDELRLWVKFPEEVLEQVMESDAWKAAEIKHPSVHEFLLKWTYP